MAAGFRDALQLSGVWLPRPPVAAAAAGFRSVLELSGVWITGANGSVEPEPTPTVSEWLVKARRRSRR